MVSQSWIKRHELLALSAVAVCAHHLLPILSILEKLGGTGYDARYSGQRQFFQRRQLGEWNLAPAERLVGFAIGSGAREQPVATTSCLAQRNGAECDIAGLLKRNRTPARVRLSEFFWFFAVNWMSGKGCLRPAHLWTVQLRSERVLWNASSYSSFLGPAATR